MLGPLLTALSVLAMAALLATPAFAADGPIHIGVLNNQAEGLAAPAGLGSMVAAQIAA